MAVSKQRHLFGGGRQRFYPWMLLFPGLGFYLLIGVGPSLATVLYSFTDATGIRGIPINWVGFDNFDEFLFQGARSRDNLDATQRTLIFMALVTIIQFSLGLVMALLVNQKLRGRMIFRTLFFVPVILGVAVQGLMWKLVLRPGGGPMYEIFSLLGLESQFLAGSNAFYWVIVVQVWANAGFTMVIFIAGMQTPFKDRVISQHTVFEAKYRTNRGVDTSLAPFLENAKQLVHKSNYSACQSLGTALRNHGYGAALYVSARTRRSLHNVVLFTPSALRSRKHLNPQRGLCETHTDRVLFRFNRKVHTCSLSDFTVNGVLPVPA